MIHEPMSVAEHAANDEERARLSLLPGATVYRLERNRSHGEQVCVEIIRLPAALFPRLQIPVPRIANLADTYGLELGQASENVCAFAASAAIAEALGVSRGTLLMMSDRLVYLRNGSPAEWRRTFRLDQQNLARLIARL